MPPLRKRAEDIVVLAKHFAKVYSQQVFKTRYGF
jgi:transcriptional regulator with AAA-type ATPase domain